MAARPQERRARPARLGPPRTTRARCSAAAPTTRSRPPRTRCGRAACRPPRPRSALAHGVVAAADRRRARRARRARAATAAWTVAGHDVKLTNLDKVLFPGRGRRAAGHQARPDPLLRRRSRRCCCPTWPGGRSTCTATPTASTARASGSKELPGHAPEWVTRWHDPDAEPGETECDVVADSVATLAWLANFGAVELHPWTSALPDVPAARPGR